MIHRTGAGDPRLAAYRRVGDAGWLARERLFVAEGRLVVSRLLALPEYEPLSIVVTPAALEALGPALAGAPCDVLVVEPEALQAITGFNFHRGCLALARRPAPRDPSALAGARRVLGLEGVGNPDNVGGLFRTAAALGAGGVLLDRTSGDPLYRKAVRTSMAATLQLPWARADDFHGTLRALQSAGFALVAATPDAPALPIAACAARSEVLGRLVLLVGAEGPGLTAATLALADLRVRIPLEPGVDSLNVVVAAGILLERLR